MSVSVTDGWLDTNGTFPATDGLLTPAGPTLTPPPPPPPPVKTNLGGGGARDHRHTTRHRHDEWDLTQAPVTYLDILYTSGAIDVQTYAALLLMEEANGR